MNINLLSDETVIALLNKRESIFTEKLACEPQNIELLKIAGDINRMKGNIEKALVYYKKIFELSNDDGVGVAISILSGSISKIKRPSFCSPFVKFKEFFSRNIRDMIFEFAIKNRQLFEPASLKGKDGKGVLNTQVRSSLILDDVDEIKTVFMPPIIETLPEALNHLQIPPFKIKGKELSILNYGNGDFFSRHKDTILSQIEPKRYVTFVYYFHSLPKMYQGGNVLLFDNDNEKSKRVNTYTRIEPANNDIIFFSSACPHKVTKVCCKSKRFEDNRFALVGWLHN